jgi:preprotein translocase subunit SecB
MSEQDDNTDNPEVAAGNTGSGAKFALQRIYVKDASFESPMAPECFRGQWQPKVNLELNTRHQVLDKNLYEVVLAITVTARNEQDEVVYLTEIQQAGIFLIEGLDGEPFNKTLGSFCPSVLFPYARESIDTLVIKGSFPALMLAPVNFDAIYDHAQAQQKEKEQASSAG